MKKKPMTCGILTIALIAGGFYWWGKSNSDRPKETPEPPLAAPVR